MATKSRLVQLTLALALVLSEACGKGQSRASSTTTLTMPSSTTPRSTTTAPPTIVDFSQQVLQKSPETLLGAIRFGYSDGQLDSLKAQYGANLNQYRHTILIGDPGRWEDVTTIFDFTDSIIEDGYKAMIQAARALVGTKLSEVDPFHDGSKISTVLMPSQPNTDKVVVITKDSAIPAPRWVGTETIAGITDSRTRAYSLVRVTSVMPNVAETVHREALFTVSPGAVLGDRMSQLPPTLMPLSLNESVGSAIAAVVDDMATRGLSETAAKSEVLRRAPVEYPNFPGLPIYKANLTEVSLAAFAQTSLFKK